MMYTVEPFIDNIIYYSSIIIIFYFFFKVKNNNYDNSCLNLILMSFITMMVSVYYKPEGGDFWGYLECYEIRESGYDVHMEDFYYRLIDLIPNNYLLWRGAVWGAATILTVITFIKLGVPSALASFMFLTFSLFDAFYYTRNALALAFLYLGVAWFVCSFPPKKWQHGLLVLIILTVTSWYLHRSMPVYIAIAVLSIFIPFNRRTLLIMLIGFPLLYGIIYIYAEQFLILNIWTSGESDKGLSYLRTTNTYNINFNGIIQEILHYAPFVYLYYHAIKDKILSDEYYLDYGEEDTTYLAYKTFAVMGILIFYISFLFIGHGSNSISSRFFTSAMTPFAFFACLYFYRNWDSTVFKRFSGLVLLYYLYKFVVTLVH